jgi:c(7)-type cytochrome triheme protein
MNHLIGYYQHLPNRLLLWLILLNALLLLIPDVGYAEYGDVVMNERSEQAGVRPVIFPHWLHRISFKCNVCHSEIGFKMSAGADKILMSDIVAGKFCGACHNDKITWGKDNCSLCHSGLPGLRSGTYGGNSTGGPGKW